MGRKKKAKIPTHLKMFKSPERVESEKSKLELSVFARQETFLRDSVMSSELLQTLIIIGQNDITSLENISELRHLQELWVVECRVKDISQLNKCSKLEKVYLYSNEIDYIPCLSKCQRLKLLSLSGNNILECENLKFLKNLQYLYIARNGLKRFDELLSEDLQLRSVNFAGNPLTQIRDIANLSYLRNLESVVFSDPLYGECPLVSFCNYRKFLIYRVKHIRNVDHYYVTMEERKQVEHFFTEKMTFCNVLRQKSINSFLKMLRAKYKDYLKKISKLRENLFVANIKYLHGKDIQAGQKFKLSEIYEERKQLYNRFIKWKENASTHVKISLQQIFINMRHCGNINFIEYAPGHTLFRICQKMLDNSLCPSARSITKIIGTRVHRITEVANKQIDTIRFSDEFSNLENVTLRILKSHPGVVELRQWPFHVLEHEFQDSKEVTLTDCLASADADFLIKIEKQRDDKLHSLMENNRRVCVLVKSPVEELNVKNLCLDDIHKQLPEGTNRMCDLYKCRNVKPLLIVEFEYVIEPRVKSSSSTISEILSADIPSWPILSNANINNLLCLTGDIRNLVEINISAQQIRRIDISLDLPNLRDLDISCNRLSSLPNIEILKNVENLNISLNKLRNLQIDEILPRLKHLNISWNELNKCRECCRAFGDFMPNLSRLNFENNPFKDIIESERVIMTAGIYLKQLQYCNETALQDVRLIAEEEFLSLENIFEYFGASEFQDLPESEFISEINKGLKSPPRINFPKVKLLNLSGNSLTTCDFLHNCCSLQWFCMSNNLLEKVSLEEPLARLSKLNFSGNFISTPEGLTQANLPVLKYLDLTHNLITSLLPMGSYISLREFYCSHNKISNLENIYNLKSWDGLKVIDLSRNPINPIKLCKSFLVYHLSTLEFVCGKRVLEADVVEANTLFGGLLDKCTLVAMHSTSYLSSMRQLSIIHCSVKEVDLTSETLPNLESLDLSKNSISYLWGLHTLQNLRTLCLSYNKVERFNRATSRTTELKSGFFPKLLTLYLDHNGIRTLVEMNLEKMAALTHIYLQHNNLGDINGIQTCAAMETLVLDSNKISAITEEDFPPSNKIKYLFMENNRTKYLCFAKRLLKLEKLFVANNKISDKGQLKHLMPLSVLTEMTIVGNPLCKKMNHYKLILEILPLLRTIDGCSVLLEDYLME